MNIEKLKTLLCSKPLRNPPDATELIELNRGLMRELTFHEQAIRKAGKWHDVCEEILREPLDVIHTAVSVNRGEFLTLLTKANLDDIHQQAQQVLVDGIDGDFFEAGVFRGGVAILLRAIQCESQQSHRRVWAADTFAGIPSPDFERETAVEIVSFLAMKLAGAFTASVAEVRKNFSRFGLLDENVRFVEGNFDDTFPEITDIKLSLLRLDCQYGHSSTTVLEHLYPCLSVGGILLMNDYGYDQYWGAKKAIDEYRARYDIHAPIQIKGATGYWKKEEHI
jgi:hypothetical protein